MNVSKMKEIAVKICNDKELEEIFPGSFSVWVGKPEEYRAKKCFNAVFDTGAYSSRAEVGIIGNDDLMLDDKLSFPDNSLLYQTEFVCLPPRGPLSFTISGLSRSSDGVNVYCVRVEDGNDPVESAIVRTNGVAEEKFSLVDIEKAVVRAFARSY